MFLNSVTKFLTFRRCTARYGIPPSVSPSHSFIVSKRLKKRNETFVSAWWPHQSSFLKPSWRYKIPTGTCSSGTLNTQEQEKFASIGKYLAVSWKRYKIGRIYYSTLKGSRIFPIQLCHFWWPSVATGIEIIFQHPESSSEQLSRKMLHILRNPHHLLNHIKQEQSESAICANILPGTWSGKVVDITELYVLKYKNRIQWLILPSKIYVSRRRPAAAYIDLCYHRILHKSRISLTYGKRTAQH